MRLQKPIPLSKKERIACLCTSLLLAAISGILSQTYRPYIYSHHLYDCHLADSLTNLFAVPAALCLCMAGCKKLKYKAFWNVFAVCLAFIIYEFIGLTFDYWDIAATLLSGALTLIPLHHFMKRKRRYVSSCTE